MVVSCGDVPAEQRRSKAHSRSHTALFRMRRDTAAEQAASPPSVWRNMCVCVSE